MPLFDKFKESASRVAAEADRALRLNRVEGAIKQRREQRQEQLLRLGELTSQLYKAGKLTAPDLTPLAQIVVDLDKQISDLEREAQTIRAEASERQVQAYGHLCSRERTLLPPIAAFCPSCGAPAIDVEPPTIQRARKCEQCGLEVTVPGNFCPACGTRLPAPEDQVGHEDAAARPQHEPEHEQVAVQATTDMGAREAGDNVLIAVRCDSCGTEVVHEAVFCPGCGKRR